MNPSVLRKTWAVVNAAPLRSLIDLSDTDLVNVLVAQVVANTPLSTEEAESISSYLSSRTTLIRDLA